MGSFICQINRDHQNKAEQSLFSRILKSGLLSKALKYNHVNRVTECPPLQDIPKASQEPLSNDQTLQPISKV